MAAAVVVRQRGVYIGIYIGIRYSPPCPADFHALFRGDVGYWNDGFSVYYKL